MAMDMDTLSLCLYKEHGGTILSSIEAFAVLHVLFAVVAVPFRCIQNMSVIGYSQG